MSAVIPDSQSCQTLADWLCYIEQSHPIHQIELGLGRVRQVADRAALADLPGKAILIGGTNGKGTTAALLEQTLLAQGYSVGVYSSPHLLNFNERLRINGADLPDADWLDAFAFIEQLRADVALTYFEFTTLVAFRILQQQQVDFCLIEVGLGGRLDATNIITPDVSVITTVDLDHQDWLGNDRETIGAEKAGIFRDQGLAVVGDLAPPQSVLNAIADLKVDARIVSQHYQYSEQSNTWQWQSAHRQFDALPIPAMPIQNAATAMAVLDVLQLLPDTAQLSAVLSGFSMPGRMQRLQRSPAIIVDVAHNPQSARYLAQQLEKLKPQYRALVAFTGMLKDKDISQTLQPLTSLFDQWHLVSLAGARGASAQLLAEKLAQCDKAPKPAQLALHDDIARAYTSVCQSLQSNELLVVFGSFFTVSAVLAGHQEVK